MDVDVGYGVSYGLSDVDVVVAVKVGVDSTLQAHLGSAHAGSVGGSSGDLVKAQEVGSTPKVERQWPFREAAESTFVGAHVRVVDISVGYPGDLFPDGSLAKLVGYFGNCGHLGPAGHRQFAAAISTTNEAALRRVFDALAEAGATDVIRSFSMFVILVADA